MLLTPEGAAGATQLQPIERAGPRTSDTANPILLELRQRIRGGLPPRAMQRVRDYIEAHLGHAVSLQALAAIVGLSMYHFSRAFKQSAGITPHEYLVECRVKRAQQLIAGTDLTLSEIALASGFADQSHCARRFRERVGVSPSRYRWAMR